MATANTTKKSTTTKTTSSTTKKTTPKVIKDEMEEVVEAKPKSTTKKSTPKAVEEKSAPTMEEMLMQYMANNPEVLAKVIAANTPKVEEEPIKKTKKVVEKVSEPVSRKIDADEDITVVNLSAKELTLSTEGYGKGKQITFPNFGSSREIIYGDLRKIIESNESFFQSGLVYVKDARVIAKHQLTNYYKNMLDYDGIVGLIDLDDKELYNVLINLPKAATTELNRGYEPHQFNYVYYHLFTMAASGELDEYQNRALEKAYRDIKNTKFDIEYEVEKHNEIYKK